MTGERAGTWVRVSTGGQNERSQVPDVTRWCDGHGYEVVRRWELRDRSAYHGEQAKYQAEVIEAVRSGEFTVLVCWTGDRVERRGAEMLLKFVREMREFGARIEASNDPLLNAAGDLGDLGIALSAWAAGQESKVKSERMRIAYSALDEAGAYRGGRVPWGYVSSGPKYGKRLVPDPDLVAVIVELFERCAAGHSIPRAGAWLEAEYGIRKLNSALLKILRNGTYATGRFEVRDSGGVTRVHRVEPLVGPALWQAANASLDARFTTGPKPRRPRQEDYSGALYCGQCGGICYRNYSSGRLGPDGEPERIRVYSCRPCKGSWNADLADAQVRETLGGDTSPEVATVIVPGSDHAAELDRVRQELVDLAARNLDEDEEDRVRAALRSEKKVLESLPVAPPRRETALTGRSRGEAWDAMSHLERVAYMRSGEFVMLLSGRGHGVEVERVWLDSPADS